MLYRRPLEAEKRHGLVFVVWEGVVPAGGTLYGLRDLDVYTWLYDGCVAVFQWLDRILGEVVRTFRSQG